MARRVFFALCALATVVLTGAVFGGYLFRMFLVVLAFAVVVRAVYATVRRGRVRIWSGWIFAIAAAIALMNILGARHRRLERSATAAVREGLVADRSELTPHVRCVALYLVAWERQPARDRTWPTKTDDRRFASEVCRRAASEHALYGDGYVEPSVAKRLEAEVAWELAP
jgi:hypothetical protein